jgi:hypothetical protein
MHFRFLAVDFQLQVYYDMDTERKQLTICKYLAKDNWIHKSQGTPVHGVSCFYP